jgi:Cu/Ag efflux protein CusF
MVLAQHDMDSGSHPAPHAPALADPSDLPYLGEVRKVDARKGKVTLRHGPITDLGMSAMAMEYLAADNTLLEGLHVGEKVKFKAERLHGAFVLTGIAQAR